MGESVGVRLQGGKFCGIISLTGGHNSGDFVRRWAHVEAPIMSPGSVIRDGFHPCPGLFQSLSCAHWPACPYAIHGQVPHILVHSDPSFSSPSRDGGEVHCDHSGSGPSICDKSPFEIFTQGAPVDSLSVRNHYGPMAVSLTDPEAS